MFLILRYTLIRNDTKKGKKWKTRTVTTTKGVAIDGGLGDDTITGSAYDDTITGGKGSNIIIFKDNFGNDTIILSPDETLILDMDEVSGISSKSDVEYIVDGDDFLIRVDEKNSVRIKGYAKEDITNGNVSLKLGGTAILTNAHIRSVGFTTLNYQGSRFDDDINAYDAPEQTQRVKVKKKWVNVTRDTLNGVNIYGGSGSDTITGSSYNDIISGGDGYNTYNFTMGYDNNTNTIISTSNHDTLYIDGSNTGFSLDEGVVIASVSGDDVIIEASDHTDSDKYLIKNAFSDAAIEYIMCNVSADYQDGDNFDVLIFNNLNKIQWAKGEDGENPK